MKKKQKIKIFGFKVRNPKSGLYLSKSGRWTSVGAVWVRRQNAINALRNYSKIRCHTMTLEEKKAAAIEMELVPLVESDPQSLLFYVDKLSS